MRADADRNRQALLQSARELFSHTAADPSMRALAEHAGVGVGTLYRHFATREALVAAVYADEIAQLGETDSLLAGRTAADALAEAGNKAARPSRSAWPCATWTATKPARGPPSARSRLL